MHRHQIAALTLLIMPMMMAGGGTALAQQVEPAAPAEGTTPSTPKSVRAFTDQTITSEDVVKTPLNTLNIDKREIPPLLAESVKKPYSLVGLTSCGRIVQTVRALDLLLGPDLDAQQARGFALSPGGLAQSAVASLLPFNGIVREISGARAEQQRMQLAIYAGGVRRAFLKGVGLQRVCPYPARPVLAHVSASAKIGRRP